MKIIFLVLFTLSFPIVGNAQTVPLSKIADIVLPAAFKRIPTDRFPAVPSKDDFSAYSKKFARGEYFQFESSTVQIYGFETGLSPKSFEDRVKSSREILAEQKDTKTYRIADIRTINNNTIFRLANEGHPKWGSLMVIVQNSSNSKRVHLNFKYPKSERLKINALAESIVRTIRFK